MNKRKNSFGYTNKVSVSHTQRAKFLDFAGATVRLAGAQILPFFRINTNVENKRSDGHFDPVTEADRSAERIIREAIERAFPEHGIFGEEYGYKPGNGLTWVIDPIDGTRAFMSGMLHWGVLLALFDGETPVVGAMYQPYTDELFLGDGELTHLIRGQEKRLLRTSSCEDLSAAVLATTGYDWFGAEDLLRFQRLQSAVQLYRLGGDCYLYGAVAMGSVHIGTDASLNAYDIQALIPIVTGAGGVVTCYDGGNPSMGGAVVATANPALHKKVLATLQTG
ncbi:MAG: inositol monophosphatase family protein [bacterium]